MGSSIAVFSPAIKAKTVCNDAREVAKYVRQKDPGRLERARDSAFAPATVPLDLTMRGILSTIGI